MKFVIIFFAILAVANGQLVSFGRCTNVSTQKNFDVAKYTGLWREIYRYEHVDQRGGDCVNASYVLDVLNDVNVTNAMVIRGVRYQINGNASLAPSSNGDGKLLVKFPTISNTSSSDYWVLSTDYDHYALVYACKELANDNRQISSWILSRTAILPPLSIATMSSVIEATEGLNWDNYRLTSHSPASCAFNSTIEI
ncbi:apolipoprotein D-like [Arctopsyche grandis]|uniref:apolipoprotein D-like n=1 Tax=Arctopsyche grandis TaxID=121162 RepID=UPI00406D8E0A